MYPDKTLWKLLDGDLPPAEASAISAAAEKDPALKRRIEDLRLLKAGVLAGAPEPPAGFAERVVALAATLKPAPIVDLLEVRRFLRRALVAAAVLAALGLVYMAVEVVPDLFRPDMYADRLLGR